MTAFIFFLVPLWATILSEELHRLSGTKGDSILFPIQLPNHTEVFSIFWHHNDKVLAIAKEQELSVKKTRFNGRLKTVGPGYSLSLTHLETDDSGNYMAQIFNIGNPIRISFRLQVNDKSSAGKASCTHIFTIIIAMVGLCFNFFITTGT
ncbi:T-lymphocyte surface antigen Ly-9-like [Xenopus laevis]|uniref:T-lymphocyte surface antigen Ly-9-like n=1 Tax=Xenopus laevis TaxID=8355 RepID=A0A8J1LGN9_XENLA|nr:T-lymphocyte surface antigen Ly-9-like [Xenopus laevis]